MGGGGSNPSELERFRSKPSELGPSFQGSGMPHSDTEARNCCVANTTLEGKMDLVPHEP